MAGCGGREGRGRRAGGARAGGRVGAQGSIMRALKYKDDVNGRSFSLGWEGKVRQNDT